MSTKAVTSIMFVCGIAGVGKTRLLRTYLCSHPEATTLSAGSIIAAGREMEDREFIRSLPPDELARNQQLLIAGFRRLRPEVTHRQLLIDGHTIIDNGKVIYEIDLEVFLELQLTTIIHVEDEPRTIVTRRTQDTARIRLSRTTEELTQQQSLSQARAQVIARELGISYRSVQSGDDRAFEAAVGLPSSRDAHG